MAFTTLPTSAYSTLDATKLTGNLPSISGASLTGISSPTATHLYAMLSVEYGVTNNTITKVQFNNVEVDTASLWDSTNKRYTMNTANAGRYFVGAVGSMKNGYNSTTNIFGTYIRKNGSNIATGYLDCRDNDLGGYLSTACNTIVNLANNDYIELFIYPYVNSTNGLGVAGSPSGMDSHLAIFRLGD